MRISHISTKNISVELVNHSKYSQLERFPYTLNKEWRGLPRKEWRVSQDEGSQPAWVFRWAAGGALDSKESYKNNTHASDHKINISSHRKSGKIPNKGNKN